MTAIRTDPDLPVPPRVIRHLGAYSVEQARHVIQIWSYPEIEEAQEIVDRIEALLSEDELRALTAVIGRPAVKHFALPFREFVARWNPPPEAVVMPPTWVPESRATIYGITVEHGTAVLEAAGYACEICRSPFRSPKQVRFDHNHATGAFRGVLCSACNTGLGVLKDDPAVLRSALRYLRDRGHYGPKTESAPPRTA